MLFLGEIQTCLLRNTAPLAADIAADCLSFVGGTRARQWARPMPRVVSPSALTGVDCPVIASSGRRHRVVGAIESRAVLTAGRVLQGSAFVAVEGGAARRLPWSHYLASAGVAEVIGKASPADLAEGFLTRPSASALDLGAIAGRAIDTVHGDPSLDGNAPFRTVRTTVRWSARSSAGAGSPCALDFDVKDDRLRTTSLRTHVDDLAAVVALCEDLALHDWLLGTLVALLDRGTSGGPGGRSGVPALQLAVEHLLHLWMPAVRVDERLAPVWTEFVARTGMVRQWNTSVHRIRDRLSVDVLALMSAVAGLPASRS